MIPSINHMVKAVTEVGHIIQQQTLQGFGVETKYDDSLVTSIDKTDNEYLRRWSEPFAVDFFGEEGNGELSGHDHIIYVDPLDGTSTFIAGKAEVSVVMTLMRKTDQGWIPVAAIIHEPMTGRCWHAQTGAGVYFTPTSPNGFTRLSPLKTNPEKAHVSVITWRDVPFNLGLVRNQVEVHPRLHHHGSGNTSINGGLIASGRMHASLYGGHSAVETAAMTLMVTEAGGVACDLFGNDLVEFEIGTDPAGKLDFLLPQGAIMACDAELAGMLVDIVCTANE